MHLDRESRSIWTLIQTIIQDITCPEQPHLAIGYKLGLLEFTWNPDKAQFDSTLYLRIYHRKSHQPKNCHHHRLWVKVLTPLLSTFFNWFPVSDMIWLTLFIWLSFYYSIQLSILYLIQLSFFDLILLPLPAFNLPFRIQLSFYDSIQVGFLIRSD